MDDGSGTASAGRVRHGGILAVGNGGDHMHRVRRASTVRQAVCASGTGELHSRSRSEGPALRFPRPDHPSPVPACVRASRSPWCSPLGPGAGCTVCPSCGPPEPSRRGGPTRRRHAGPKGQLPGGALPGLHRSPGPHAAGSGTQPAMGLDARDGAAGKGGPGPQHALHDQAAAGPAHVGTGARRELPAAQVSGDTVRAPRGNCAAGRGTGAVPGSGRHRYGRCTGSVSGIGRIRSGLVAQGGRGVGSQARLCG